MSVTLQQIAELVGGELTGDPHVQIDGAAILRDVQRGQITIADDEKQQSTLAESLAIAAIVSDALTPATLSFVRVDNVHRAFAIVVAHLNPAKQRQRVGISANAHVSSTATIGDDVDIYPGASIGDDVVIGAGCTIHPGVCVMADCHIGENVTLFPNVVLYDRTALGARSIVHAGAAIGAHGFGYETVQGQHRSSAQLGHVEIGCDVEIGANTTIDRGTYGPTTIGDGTKIDNMVMIAHNCKIGKHNIFCSQVGVAGSCETGDYVVMGGQVGMKDHLTIGNFAKLAARSALMSDVPDNATFVGVPAMAERDFWPILATQMKLPALRKQLKRLQQTVDQIVAGEAETTTSHQDAA